MSSSEDLLVSVLTKGKVIKKENGIAVISVAYPNEIPHDVDLSVCSTALKRDFIEQPLEAVNQLCEITNESADAHAKTKEMLQLAIAELNKERERYTALETKIDELKTAILDSTMAQQRRHKYFAEYVWKFNNSTMQQLGDIGIRQAEFTQLLQSCKPTLQDVVNYTNRGVEL